MASGNKISLFCLSVSALALGLSSYMTAGLIPLISKDFSVSIGLAAQLVTAFTLPYGLLSPVAVGITSDKSLRKNVLVYLGVFVLSNGVSVLAPEFYSLMLSRAIAGVSAGAFLACGITASSRLNGAGKQGKSISTIMAGMAIGTVIGVPLSLVIAQSFGWRSAMLLVSVLGMVAWLGLMAYLPDIYNSGKPNQGSRFALLANASILKVLFISLFAAISSLGMYTFLASFVEGVKSGEPTTMYLWFWGVGGVCGSIIIGYIVDMCKLRTILFVILFILAASFLAIYCLSAINILLICIPLVFWGAVGWALQVPQNNELLNLREAYGDGNLAVGLNQSSVYLGGSIGSISGGLLLSYGADVTTLPLIFILPVLLAFLVLLLPPGRSTVKD